MRRIADVFDVWFDSGSMPYAQVHYPFENRDWFDTHYPGDFIVEYIGQTRGWFYTLHVLATALFDRPAFKTCVAHGIVLGSDGQKMSKSLRNYPDVSEVFDRDGSDAMRWFLMASPILRGGNLIVTEQGIRDGVRQVLLPFWNAYSFLALYAPKVGTWRTDSTNVLDRYILAKLAVLRDDLTVSMDGCDISGACEQLRQFTEALTNWYVRRSRSRFWDEDPDAIDTLHTVLEVTATAGRAAAADDDRDHLARHHRRTLGASVRLARSRPVARRRRRWSTRWTRCVRCARWRRRCARPRSCGCGCRCRN